MRLVPSTHNETYLKEIDVFLGGNFTRNTSDLRVELRQDLPKNPKRNQLEHHKGWNHKQQDNETI